MTDAEACEVLQRMRVGDLRSTFAQALFPYDRTKYGTRGQWAKAVGIRVSADIHNNPSLRIAMQEAGYKAGEKGYTQKQKIVLIKFYRADPLRTDPLRTDPLRPMAT